MIGPIITNIPLTYGSCMRGLFVLFIIIPIVEMLLLFEVSDHIGGLYTVGLVVLTAAIGIRVLKSEGIATITKANERLQSGEIPAQQIAEGLFLAIGGAFLLTPGFITDSLGFIFLIGPSRRFIVRELIKSGKFTLQSFSSGTSTSGFTFNQFSADRKRSAGSVYEGEVVSDDDEMPSLGQKDKD